MRNDSSSSLSTDEECHYMHGLETGIPDQCHLSKSCCCHQLLAELSTILLNALVNVAVASRHRLQSTSYVLVAWLADADLLNRLVNQEIQILVELTRIVVFRRDLT